jgi:hypothetical protein
LACFWALERSEYMLEKLEKENLLVVGLFTQAALEGNLAMV